jgi:L-xylulokinase
MRKRFFIGLDNGGSVTKAGLFDQNGSEVAVANRLAQSITPRVGHVERDSNQLFDANVQCIREVIQKSRVNPADIGAISVTGHGNGLYLVGHNGKPSYNGIISTDTRAAGCVNRIYETGAIHQILPVTNQNIWAGQLSALLSWFKANKPEVLNRSRYAFSCTDYVRYCLTGEAYGEMTNMSTVNLMNLGTKQYDDEILKLFDISEYKHLLPPIRVSHEICGHITQEAADRTGLLCGTPVAGGLVDFAACPLATGVVNEDQLSITTGTWAICIYLSKTPISDIDLLMTSLYPINGLYSIMEGSMTSASNLEWFVQKLMKKEKQEAEKAGVSVYQLCNEMVASLGPEDASVMFLPYLYGTNVNAEAKCCLMGINYLHERAHLVRAIYEGVAFSTMMHVEKLLKFKKGQFQTVRVSGGATRSREWMQIFADLLQMPIEVPDANELGAMGAAICAAVGVGEFASFEEAIQCFLHVKYICQPNTGNKEIYIQKYELYKKLVLNMNGMWGEWNRIFEK